MGAGARTSLRKYWTLLPNKRKDKCSIEAPLDAVQQIAINMMFKEAFLKVFKVPIQKAAFVYLTSQ